MERQMFKALLKVVREDNDDNGYVRYGSKLWSSILHIYYIQPAADFSKGNNILLWRNPLARKVVDLL